MKKQTFTQLLTLRAFAFLLMSLGLNACYAGPDMDCILFFCWSDEDEDYDYHHDYDSDPVPAYDFSVTDLTQYSNGPTPILNYTTSKANNGLRIEGSTADFIQNEDGKGGHLLVSINAADAKQSCDVKLNAVIDDVRYVSTVVYAVGEESFLAESLGTGCLSSKAVEGSAKGIAVFEIPETPKTLVLESFDYATPVDYPLNTVGSRGNKITLWLAAYSNKLNVTITAADGDNNPVEPLYFEGFVTGIPLHPAKNNLFKEIELDPIIKNLRRDETRNSINYEYGLKDINPVYLYSTLIFHVTSLRNADY
jgi:hypothetical protein